jgi:hypothetical protein
MAPRTGLAARLGIEHAILLAPMAGGAGTSQPDTG